MDRARTPPPPGPESPELSRRRSEGVDLWRQYQGLLSGAQSDLEAALSAIDQQIRQGVIAPEQAQARELETRQAHDARVREIEAGPTRSLIVSEFEAQRDVARTAYDQQYQNVLGQRYELRESPSYGEPGYYRLYTSGRGEEMEEYVGRTDPRAAIPQFEFAASPDDYWSALAGPDQAAPTAGAAMTPSAAQRARITGSSAGDAVGVGRVYSWY